MSDEPSQRLNVLDQQMLGEQLVSLANQRMPFGRFAGQRLIDLPEPYVVWFRNNGYPSGKLGNQLATLYEIKRNGLENLLRPLCDAIVDDLPPGRPQ